MTDQAKPDAKPEAKTVRVTAAKFHTNGGKPYQPGEAYDVPAHEVDNLVSQGMAHPAVAANQPPKK